MAATVAVGGAYSAPPREAEVAPGVLRKVLTASFIGNFVEWFDYASYGYFATVIAVVFFPDIAPSAALMATFAVFAISFVIRPIGGIIWGSIGDKVGRRTALSWSILIMSGATTAIALLPGYAQIGMLAPALLLLIRMVQGFSASGEYAGAASFIAEYSPVRKRGFYTSIVPASTAAGLLAGSLMSATLFWLLSDAQMQSFGWRALFLLGLPLGAAILLGAILAPTDPVLASDVQVERPGDRDRVRFGLTGEAGLNDGAATPFVLLGLALLGQPAGAAPRDLAGLLGRWLAVDVLWAVAAGLGIGWLLGYAIGRLVLYLRREHKEAVGLDDFLTLGLIALSYGAALLIHAYGFLAVFAAGLALRRVEMIASGEPSEETVDDPIDLEPPTGGGEQARQLATDPQRAPAYLAQAVLGFNEQLERIGEVAVVVLLGGLLRWDALPAEALWFVPLLFLAIRPLSVWVALRGSRASAGQRRLMAWFGVRGIGSVYYLAYALHRGLDSALADQLAALTLATVAASIVVHGISVTPLMRLYKTRAAAEYGADLPTA